MSCRRSFGIKEVLIFKLSQQFRDFRTRDFDLFVVQFQAHGSERGLQQVVDAFDFIKRTRDGIQGRGSGVVLGVLVRAMVQECPDDFGAAEESGGHKGRTAILGPGVQIRPSLNQGPGRRNLAKRRRRVQRAASAVRRFFVQIRGGFDVLLNGL